MRNAGNNGSLYSEERVCEESDRKLIILSPGFGDFDSIANKLESGQYEKKDILICTLYCIAGFMPRKRFDELHRTISILASATLPEMVILKITVDFSDEEQFVLWNNLLAILKTIPLPKHLRIAIFPGSHTWENHTNSNEIFNRIASLFNSKQFQSLNSLFLDLNSLNNAVDLEVDAITNLFNSFQFAPANGYFKLGLSNNSFNREAVLHITNALKQGKPPHNFHLAFENNDIDNFGFISFLDACMSPHSPDNWSVELGELNGHISAEIIADYVNATNDFLFRKGALNFKILPHQSVIPSRTQKDENEDSALIPYFKQQDNEKYTISVNHLTEIKNRMQWCPMYPVVNGADSMVRHFIWRDAIEYHHLNQMNSRHMGMYLIYFLLLLKMTQPYCNFDPHILEMIMTYLVYEPTSSCMKGIEDVMYTKSNLEIMNKIPRFSSQLFTATAQLREEPDSWVAQWATNNGLTP